MLDPQTPPTAAVEEFRVDDWLYLTSREHDEVDEDGRTTCRKFDHHAFNAATGETRLIRFTPYRKLDRKVFAHLIDLGFPDLHERLGNMREDDVRFAYLMRAQGAVRVQVEDDASRASVFVLGRKIAWFSFEEAGGREQADREATAAAHAIRAFTFACV